MSNYMDLVLVEKLENPRAVKRIVCRAPWMSHLERGMQVNCKTAESETFSGEVVAVMDIAKDEGDSINFILECADQIGYGLPKIISRIKVVDFKYEDEDDA